MAVAKQLLEVLVCVESRQPLLYFPGGETGSDARGAFLYCPESRLKYRVHDDIPIMLLDEAERLEPPAAEALLRRAQELGVAQA